MNQQEANGNARDFSFTTERIKNRSEEVRLPLEQKPQESLLEIIAFLCSCD